MRFLFCALAFSIFTATAAEMVPALVTVHPEKVGSEIPDDFLGLSYEKSALAAKHFRPDNLELLNLHRNLSGSVIRVGGNKVELCSWQREEIAAEPGNGANVITPSCLDSFYAFAKAAGWKVIHGVNLANRNPEMSADEIAYALEVGGDSILAFEVGNEPDHYDKPTKNLRAKGYDFALYQPELAEAQRVIISRNPNAPLAGPATTGGDADWFGPCVADFKNRLALATSHFYPLSAKSLPPPTAEQLLSEASKAKAINLVMNHVALCRSAGIPYRLGECNSASMGGTDGVSDTFVATIWAADFLFDVAEHGAAGVNLHTIFGTHGYTAISYDKKNYSPRPLYYALLLFKDAGRGKILATETAAKSNVTSHATLTADGKLRVVIINKSLTEGAEATVLAGSQRSRGTVARLSAATPMEQTGITYSGATVNPDGRWTAAKPDAIQGTAGKFQVTLSPCSAAVLTLEAD